MGSRRDSQCSALYKWERRLPTWPGRRLTLDGCRELVARVWFEHFASAPPEVTDGRGRRTACYVYEDHEIRLPRWSRTEMVVLHEVAHAVLWAVVPEAAAHGPEYARLYLDLLARYAGVDPGVASSRAERQRPRRVHFAPPGSVIKSRRRSQLRLWR